MADSAALDDTMELPKTPAERAQMREWAMGLSEVLFVGHFATARGALAESFVEHHIAKKLPDMNSITVKGEPAQLMLIRAWEGSRCDLYIAIVTPPTSTAEKAAWSTPRDDATDLEAWQWACEQSGKGTVRLVQIDVKYHNATMMLHKETWSYRVSGARRERVRDPVGKSSVIIAMFNGVGQQCLVMPSAAYFGYPSSRFSDATILGLACPPRLALFAVDIDQLAEVCPRLVLAAAQEDVYISPSTDVNFHGWMPKLHGTSALRFGYDTEEDVAASNSGQLASSFITLNRLLRSLVSADASTRVEFNPVQPFGYDFYLQNLGLCVEHKVSHKGILGFLARILGQWSEDHILLDDHRPWHVFWLDCVSDQFNISEVFCVLRSDLQELDQVLRPYALQTGQSLEALRWNPIMRAHTFTSVSSALDYVKLGRHNAIGALTKVLQRRKPSDYLQQKRYLDVPPLSEEDAASQEDHPPSALSHQINWHCMDAAEGLYLPLGRGHPQGSHTFIDLQWTDDDIKLYTDGSSLPVLSMSRLAKLPCLVVRETDLSKVQVISMRRPLHLRRGTWYGRVHDRQIFFLGRLKSSSLYPETMDGNNAQYLLIPDEMTVMAAEGQMFKSKMKHNGEKCYIHNRADLPEEHFNRWPPGKAYGEKVSNRYTDLEDVLLPGTITADNQLDYVLSYADDSLTECLRKILGAFKHKRKAAIASAFIAEDDITDAHKFSPEPYVQTYSELLQMMWDYGCTMTMTSTQRSDYFSSVFQVSYRRANNDQQRSSPPTIKAGLLQELGHDRRDDPGGTQHGSYALK